MKEIKTLLNRGWDNLSPNEQRDVVKSLSEHLGNTEESIKNWIGGGIRKEDVVKPMMYRNVKKSEWYLLRDIFDIIFDGVVFEEKSTVVKEEGQSVDALMKEIDGYKTKERREFFRHLYSTNRCLYNEVSELYTLHKKYGGDNNKANLSRYAKINKERIIEEKETKMLKDLQNGGKIRL
jgi:hypothetical protein